MKPWIAAALLVGGAAVGGGAAALMQPPPPEPVVEYVEVPAVGENDGSCVDGFILAIRFVHETLVDLPAGMAVYNSMDESLTPLTDWFPEYEAMSQVVDAAAAQECGNAVPPVPPAD